MYLAHHVANVSDGNGLAIDVSSNHLTYCIQMDGKLGSTVDIEFVSHYTSLCMLNCHIPHFLGHTSA